MLLKSVMVLVLLPLVQPTDDIKFLRKDKQPAYIVKVANSNMPIPDNKKICTGSIIHESWAISAASCVYKADNPSNIKLLASGDPTESFDVTQVVMYPKMKMTMHLLDDIFDRTLHAFHAYEHNLVLLRLKHKISSKRVKALSFQDDPYDKSSTSTLFGFGHSNLPFSTMLSVDFNSTDCDPLDKKLVCKVPALKLYPDTGDIGGPLVMNGRQVGMLSMFFPDGFSFNPVPPIVFTNLNYQEYNDWIWNVTNS